ncbi:multiple monosaccharide ABC transporter substrate-binding protein [Streptomyces sp. NPDC000941]
MRKARAVRALAALAALLTLSLTATACGQEAVGGSRYKGGDSNTIGISMPVKTSARWIADGKNMVKQFQAAGYKTDLQYGEDDVRTQVAQLENMVTKQYKLLVIAPIDGTALTDVMQSAHDANIPVISYDRLILGSKYVDYYATFDNFKVGVLQASYLVKKLGLTEGKKGPFNIELFAGSSDDNNTRYFFNGAMSVLKPYLADGRLVVRSGQTKLNQLYTAKWSGKDAQDRMENLLNKAYSNADLNAVLSPYDGMSMGILSALQGVGYGTKSKPYPFVSGQDAELPSIKSIIRGEQTQTVYKDTRKLAKATVQMATAKLDGGKPQVNDTKSYNNGKKIVPAYLLNPVSIDKSNTQLLVKEGYYTAGQLK